MAGVHITCLKNYHFLNTKTPPGVLDEVFLHGAISGNIFAIFSIDAIDCRFRVYAAH